MRHIITILIFSIEFCILSQTAFAAPPSTKPSQAKVLDAQRDAGNRRIGEELASSDPSAVQNGIDEAMERVRKSAWANRNALESWTKTLVDNKHGDEAVALSQAGLAAGAGTSQPAVEVFAELHVHLLLELKRYDQALASAKSYYNVCSMGKTADALTLLNVCLEKAHPGDAELLKRFRDEEMAGAVMPELAAPGAAETGAAAKPTTTLAAIHVDGASFEAAAKETPHDYHGLFTRGNLFLMADKIAEARSAFEEAYEMASDHDVPEASEALARCIKAEDGTIGRANAYVMSLRPAATTQP